MDQQEEAGLETELEAKLEFCKQLQSLFMSLPGSWFFPAPPQPEKAPAHTCPILLQDAALHTDRESGSQSPHPSSPRALEQSLAQHQELFLQYPPVVPRQQHFPLGYRNSPCSNRTPVPQWVGLQKSPAAQGSRVDWDQMSPLHTPKG